MCVCACFVCVEEEQMCCKYYIFPFKKKFLTFSSSKGLQPWWGKVRHCRLFFLNPKAFLTILVLDWSSFLSLLTPKRGLELHPPCAGSWCFQIMESCPKNTVCLGATELIATSWSFASPCKEQGCGQAVKSNSSLNEQVGSFCCTQ